MNFGKQVEARCPRFLFRQVFHCGCIDASIHKEFTDGFSDGAVVCCSWVLGKKFIPGCVGSCRNASRSYFSLAQITIVDPLSAGLILSQYPSYPPEK